jgi:hypothetical protein
MISHLGDESAEPAIFISRHGKRQHKSTADRAVIGIAAVFSFNARISPHCCSPLVDRA